MNACISSLLCCKKTYENEINLFLFTNSIYIFFYFCFFFYLHEFCMCTEIDVTVTKIEQCGFLYALLNFRHCIETIFFVESRFPQPFRMKLNFLFLCFLSVLANEMEEVYDDPVNVSCWKRLR